MTEILFYHLEFQTLEDVLPSLLEKTLQRHWSAVIQSHSQESVMWLDKYLWIYREDSFLPHGCKRVGYEKHQPIWLTDVEETPNEAQVLFLVNGVERHNILAFERCVYLFDARNKASLTQARSYWSHMKETKHDVTYYQQSENGKWGKKM